MSRIVFEISDKDEEDFRKWCCWEGESVASAVLRIVKSSIDYNRLRTIIRDGGL